MVKLISCSSSGPFWVPSSYIRSLRNTCNSGFPGQPHITYPLQTQTFFFLVGFGSTCVTVISALSMWRQEDQELKVSLGYKRPCLKNVKQFLCSGDTLLALLSYYFIFIFILFYCLWDNVLLDSLVGQEIGLDRTDFPVSVGAWIQRDPDSRESRTIIPQSQYKRSSLALLEGKVSPVQS